MLVAPDSFKGTFTAGQVAAAIGRGLEEGGYATDLCPIGDGGEGTVEALVAAFDAERVPARVHDPLGREIEAEFAVHEDTAFVETAAASGLTLVAERERDAVAASTAGTGELVALAIDGGARTVCLAVGGSATTDGGAGAIDAIEQRGGLRGARLVVLCDVRTTFQDAAGVFGPQKGANPSDVEQLTERLIELARRLPRDPRDVPMTGAAGGLSGGLWATFGAELVAGAAFVLDAVGFDARLRVSRAVVTGEGKLDRQSRAGKAVSEVARRATIAAVPCYALVGTRRDVSGRALGLRRVLEASTLEDLEGAGRMLAGLV